MEEQAQLGCAKTHHEKGRVVPGNKSSSKMDEMWVKACDKDMNRCKPVTAIGAQSIVSGSRAEMI